MVTKRQVSEVMKALGKRTSPKKAKASKRNAKLGGRPKLIICDVCGITRQLRRQVVGLNRNLSPIMEYEKDPGCECGAKKSTEKVGRLAS